MTDEQKNDNPRLIVLEDGRELTIDIDAITWAEAREMMFMRIENPEEREEKDWRYAELLGRTVGLNAEEMMAFGLRQFKVIDKRVSRFILNPLSADPN